ncbi:Sorting nexin-1 [Stylosanthes scabra]|uniref:Sorting nexin-1 n=1 Tax=Stylosanthes scabra TaxID=79078 RepID=A0ABU6WC24_9FABA|nr:Sorting nexin-1 [Stylosanthes scabra]
MEEVRRLLVQQRLKSLRKVMNAERERKKQLRCLKFHHQFHFFLVCERQRLHRSEKLAKAEREYNELKAESEQATKTFESIVRLMNEEIGRFQEQKTLDMGIAFHEFVKGQARLANDITGAWRSLLPKLEACSAA